MLGNGTSAPTFVAPSTSGNVLTSNGTTWQSAQLNRLTSGTAQASTSGTAINFTGIPSWVKRITVMFSGVSTNGTSHLLVQIGDSAGVENTGYVSNSTLPFGPNHASNYIQQDNGIPAVLYFTPAMKKLTASKRLLLKRSCR
jgi:hypothetical protein